VFSIVSGNRIFEALGNVVCGWQLATPSQAGGRRKSARPRASKMSNALLWEWQKLGYDGRRICDDNDTLYLNSE
jgi:hypothetical protein